MKINFSQIYEGWRNKLIPPSELKELIEKTSKERMEICRGCEFNSKNKKGYKSMRPDEHCTDCGCSLVAKTRCLSCKCPLTNPLWKEVLTGEQEQAIHKMITDGKQE